MHAISCERSASFDVGICDVSTNKLSKKSSPNHSPERENLEVFRGDIANYQASKLSQEV